MERAVDHVAIGSRFRQGFGVRLVQSGGFQLSGLRQGLQAQEQPEEPSEMGVRQGTAVPVSPLRLQGEAEDAHRAAYGTDAQGADLQAGARVKEGEGGGEERRGASVYCTSSASFAGAIARGRDDEKSEEDEKMENVSLTRTTDVEGMRDFEESEEKGGLRNT